MDNSKKCVEEININYQKLFEQVESLKKVLLVAGHARVGTDFFQSLLDSHPEILQLTGICFFHLWWSHKNQKDNISNLIDEFVWHSCDVCNHIAMFKSYYNKKERWNQLGDNKNDFFEVDIGRFKSHMINILTGKELNSRNFFLAANLAYGLTTGVDIKKTKILFYHAHHIDKLGEFYKDFPDFDLICSIREPRNVLASGMEHWKNYDLKSYNANFLYQSIRRIFEESELAQEYTSNIKTLKLEDLHLFSQEVLEEFCNTYGLKFNNSLLESSYHGKKWWGDSLSGKYLDGFNKNITKKKWNGKLFFYDNFLIEFILEDRLKHYGYPFENKISNLYLPLACILIILPTKHELKILIHSIKNSLFRKGESKFPQRGLLFYLGRGLYFYTLRVALYYKFILKKVRKRLFLADSFISERRKNLHG